MKKIFILIIVFNFLIFNFANATSAGNATDRLYYNLNEPINASTPLNLFLFAYYDQNGDFVYSGSAGELAGDIIDNNPALESGQNIKVIYAYQDDILTYKYSDVLYDYENREYPVVYYTNTINIGYPHINNNEFNNISIVSFISTSTKINNNQTLTTGEYNIPFLLLEFIVYFTMLTIFIITILLFLKNKK